MANIVDYLTWRGDLTFEERPFNDVDNLILATLSYLDFSGIVPGPEGKPVTIAKACQMILEETGGDVRPRVRAFIKITGQFLVRLASSRRFSTMLLHDYVDELDEEQSLQFSAVSIDVSPRVTYVSYRGTDSTLVGWREDFMLSFTVLEAQRRAVAYLEKAATRAQEQGHGLYVGGHSKGGNLAVYAAMVASSEARACIKRVWSNDGPGLAPEVMPHSPHSKLGHRYRRIVPEYDMVGIIFERDDDPRIIVESSASGAGQHDPFTWQANSFGMCELSDLQTESKLIKESLDLWIKDIPLEQRAVVVDQFFDALAAGGARKMSEVMESRQAMKAVVSAMGDLDESTIELVKTFASIVVAKTMDAAAEAAQDAAGSALRAARRAVSEWRRRAEAERANKAARSQAKADKAADDASKSAEEEQDASVAPQPDNAVE